MKALRLTPWSVSHRARVGTEVSLGPRAQAFHNHTDHVIPARAPHSPVCVSTRKPETLQNQTTFLLLQGELHPSTPCHRQTTFRRCLKVVLTEGSRKLSTKLTFFKCFTGSFGLCALCTVPSVLSSWSMNGFPWL